MGDPAVLVYYGCEKVGIKLFKVSDFLLQSDIWNFVSSPMGATIGSLL
jgi:hypothetical protein